MKVFLKQIATRLQGWILSILDIIAAAINGVKAQMVDGKKGVGFLVLVVIACDVIMKGALGVMDKVVAWVNSVSSADGVTTIILIAILVLVAKNK
jgi:hypothetical protein